MTNHLQENSRTRFFSAKFILLAMLVAPQTPAVLYNEHPGSDVQVHYVHLTGYGDTEIGNEAAYQRLTKTHQSCITFNQQKGLPYINLPPSGIPKIVKPEDLEIYYSSNRSLTVMRHTDHNIDPVSCELKVSYVHKMELVSAIGRCTIDLLRKTAVGVCDDQMHARAPDSSRSKIPPDTLSAMDLKKLTPQLRAEVIARYEQVKKTSMVLAGEKKILGYVCEIRRTESLKTESCVSHPPGSFLIPASFYNGGIPGLLLELNNPGHSLLAQEVKTSLGVAKSIFEIPKGFELKSFTSPIMRP